MVSLRSSSIPLTSLSYADFDQSARRKELPLRKRAGRAVRWGKRQVSAVNQSNVGSKSRAVNVRVHTYTHTHTLTSTRRHTLKQKNTNIVFLSCREPSQQVSWQITPNLSLPLLSLPFYVIIFSVGIDLVGLERALCSAPKKKSNYAAHLLQFIAIFIQSVYRNRSVCLIMFPSLAKDKSKTPYLYCDVFISLQKRSSALCKCDFDPKKAEKCQGGSRFVVIKLTEWYFIIPAVKARLKQL